MIEIERKFLVKNDDFLKESSVKKKIKQGFLNTDPQRTIRIRIIDDKGFLTVKGISNEAGTSRFEWETEIKQKDAANLLALCERGVIEKTRYHIEKGQHLFEIDVFEGRNKGLILAEVELEEEDEKFETPPWLGTEVTGDKKYYNSQLSKNPFQEW